jgi:hypothetical protein
MRRVLLLVCLIVSMVELDWERARVYFLSSVASLLLVVWSELLRLRKAQKTTTAEELRAEQMVLPEAHLVLANPRDHSPFLRMVEPPVIGNVPDLDLTEAQGEKRT